MDGGIDEKVGIAERSVGWARAALGLAARLADLALPPLCISCGRGVEAHGALCGPCWVAVGFIDAPFCPVSGLPFPYDPGPGIVSAAALASPPPYARARAVMRYSDESAKLVHRYKYGDRMEVAPAFARWMARAGRELLEDAHIVAPVPLHRRRLFSRRFNQSAELARRLSRLSGVDFVPDLLERVRATRPQVGLSGNARRRNVAGAFRLRERLEGCVKGRIVVIVDDVITTGATVDACARVLNAAGAAEVRVLCLARVVPGEGATI
ncbi:ComF family protein [Parvibaculum sp.]|uniref:ComF family protein n=1 Tax=Parvibaculum sp. TaxID=2024848 RepID=UPI003211324D